MTAVLALLALAAPAVPAAAAPCRLAPADQRWIDGALANWRFVERSFLKLSPAPVPEVVAIGPRCVATTKPVTGRPIVWRGVRHSGQVRLPDGRRVPVGVLSFAAPAEKGAQPFFAMSTPAIWRAGGVTSELGLETLMDQVLLHEMAHTRQAYWATPVLNAVQARYKLADATVNDDEVQARFGKDPAYVAAYERERDLLYAAVAAPTDAGARALAGEALAALRTRRARWFAAEPWWRDFDDVFLQMEGLGQWVGYRWFIDGPRRTYAPAVALEAVRRRRNQWTQDEGLALMLVVDRLVPGWQGLAFGERPALAEELLARAAGEGGYAPSSPAKRPS